MTFVPQASSEARLLIDRASWTLVDQCVVSLGNFVLDVLLARHLAAANYGTFALSLTPSSACEPSTTHSSPIRSRSDFEQSPDERAGLLGNTVLLAAALSLGLFGAACT